MNDKIAILYAGEDFSIGLAYNLAGRLKEKGIGVEHYKLNDNNIDEDSYKDKLNTYITQIARFEKVIVIISEKYLTESIYCQEEIRELVGKYKINFRSNVYIICSDEKIYNKIYNETEKYKLLDKAIKLIENNINILSNTKSCSEDRINEIRFCKNTIKEFFNDILGKKDYVYQNTETDKLVGELINNIGRDSISPDKEREDELSLFLSLFESCFPNGVSNAYCESLELSSKNEDMKKISILYQSCMLPNTPNFIEHIAKNRDKLTAYSQSGIHYDNYIMKRFIEEYYIIPDAIYKSINVNGEAVDTFSVSSKEIFDSIYTNLDDNKMVFLEGGVGEGKTTFIYKLIYETINKNRRNGNKYIYKHLTNLNAKSVDTMYQEIEKELENNSNAIVIIDNLDSFSFEHERFMFTKGGFRDFKIQIQKIKELVTKLKSLISDNKAKSALISVRPYVLSHFFDNRVLENVDYSIIANSSIYSLKYKDDIAEKVIFSRIQLFREMIEKLLNDDTIQKGRKEIFEKYRNDILSMLNLISYETYKDGTLKKHKIKVENKGKTKYIETFVLKKNKILNELLKVTTQGLRTIVRLYRNLGFNDELFSAYFTNTIFLLYILGLHKKYSQILPFRCGKRQPNNSGKIYNYPNMFLSVAVSEANIKRECARPHKMTYWLKIFVLLYISKNENASIKEIINVFSKYDAELVKLALGSLGTINEYNCIEYDFPTRDNIDYSDFIVQTKAKLTKRGKYIIDNFAYLNYNNLEFFIDDWQLPKPRLDKIFDDSFEDKNFIKILKQAREQLKNITYEYLSGKQKKGFNFRGFMKDKTKLIIWYTYIFEASLNKELQQYNINFWEYDNRLFIKKRQEIVQEATNIVESHYNSQEYSFKRELEEFNKDCNNYYSYIDKFFQEVFEKNIKAICVEC